MSLSKYISLEEELEVDKLYNKELAAKQSSEYDILYQKLESDDTEETNNSPVSKKDLMNIKGIGSKTADAIISSLNNNEDTEEVSAESYRNIYISISEESFIDSSLNLLETITEGFRHVGLEFGIPALRNVYKGVLFALNRIVIYLFKSISALYKYADRKLNAFSNLKSDIATIKKSLELIQDKDLPSNVSKYSNTKVINSLKIKDSLDLVNNLTILEGFITTTIDSLSGSIYNEIGYIKHIANYSISGIHKLPSKILQTTPRLNSSFIELDIEGYKTEESNMLSTMYKSKLPGDIVFISILPDIDTNDTELLKQAYDNSNMFLGFDDRDFKEINTLDYMTTKDLSIFLDHLDKLCDLGIKHVDTYKSIIDKKKSLRYSYRNYIANIVKSTTKLTYKDTMVEYINYRSTMIDKVYVPASMDIHDYLTKIIISGMSYAKSNIQQF